MRGTMSLAAGPSLPAPPAAAPVIDIAVLDGRGEPSIFGHGALTFAVGHEAGDPATEGGFEVAADGAAVLDRALSAPSAPGGGTLETTFDDLADATLDRDPARGPDPLRGLVRRRPPRGRDRVGTGAGRGARARPPRGTRKSRRRSGCGAGRGSRAWPTPGPADRAAWAVRWRSDPSPDTADLRPAGQDRARGRMAETTRQKGQGTSATVCAIGASAAGEAALHALVATLPADLGLAYVVLCAAVDAEELAGRLASGAGMPVVSLGGAGRLERDRIHLAPPDRRLAIEGDAVTTLPHAEPRQGRAPIDMLFRVVAAAREDGLAVLLSGPEADGAVGLRAIREGAGVTLVQSPSEAEFATMPRAAIAMGAADVVLPVGEMGARIAALVRAEAAVAASDAGGATGALGRILDQLHVRAGHDFSGYDEALMMLRVRRRAQIAGQPDLGAYEAFLRGQAPEARALFSDLLIPMTTFFRDPRAFEALAEAAIPTIVEERHRGHGVRAWVAGCSTGEEAYSLAMLFLEEADRRGVSFPLQIFATDVDAGALATARDGRYPGAIEADVSQERLQRFFVREAAHWRIGKRLRDSVLFAEHSLLTDPPFTRMDLDSCRNVLKLFGPAMRTEALRRVHYALRPDGHLFLGAGEAADPELFAALRGEASLYVAQPLAVRLAAEVIEMPRPARGGPAPPGAAGAATLRPEAWEAVAPPSIVVDEERRVLRLSETAGRYLRPSGGPFPHDLTRLARPELRGDLLTALHRALAEGRSSVTAPQAVAMGGERRRVGLHVRPLAEEEPARALVMFLDGGALGSDDGEEVSAEVADLREQRHLLQGRLALCQAEREAAADRQGALEEELGSARQEHQSTLEEHQSTLGELEACRAERESDRQELKAVSSKLRSTEEASLRGRSALEELAAAAGVGAMILDADLRPATVVPSPDRGARGRRRPRPARADPQPGMGPGRGRCAPRDAGRGIGGARVAHRGRAVLRAAPAASSRPRRAGARGPGMPRPRRGGARRLRSRRAARPDRPTPPRAPDPVEVQT